MAQRRAGLPVRTGTRIQQTKSSMKGGRSRYGKAELMERIDDAIKEKTVAEEKAREEARLIAEAKAKAEAEAREKDRIEAERKAAAERTEQKRKVELSQKKRKLAFERNGIQYECFMENSNSESWNHEYAEYLMAEKIIDYDS